MKLNWKVGAVGLVVVLAVAVAVGLLRSSEDKESKAQEPVTTTTLTVSGSGGTTAVLKGIQDQFAADTPGYRLEVLTGTGTSEGVKGVGEGILDLVAMARPPKDDEPVEYLEFGQSGQAFIVQAEVGITELTSEQAQAIFSGEITNWSEIGGPDLKLIVYVRDEGDSTTKSLRQSVLGDDPFPESAKVMTSQGDMITAVENTPGAIGMCTWPAAAAMDAKVKMLVLDGVSPDDPAYPIVNALGVGYSATNQARVQPLLDWLVSEKGKATLREFDVLFKP